MDNDIRAYIMAGGKSTRFKKDKSLHPFEGTPLIQIVYDIISPLFSSVTIVANDPSKYAFLTDSIIQDIIPGLGPLGGIYSALEHAETNRIFVFACDTPFINADFISYMKGLPDYYDIIIPELYGNYEPLHAIYGPGCLAPVKEAITSGGRKITDFFERVSLRKVTDEEILFYSNDSEEPRMFLNINYQHDLQ